MKTEIIDLRSDTVTKPTTAMRRAMAEAEVGDDVYGEDPTVNMLELRAAELFEKETALFVPTGTMGNQIAVNLQTHHGQEVVCERRAHVADFELAMTAAFSGCQLRQVEGRRGILEWEAIAPPIYYRAQTGLIVLENTHNMAGGTVTPLATLEEIWAGAAQLGLPLHLDGARIFNASVALGVSVAKLARGFSTVMFCLSKGLCAPAGSLLVGPRALMERARPIRKMLGGGMRQVGVLAAAGLIALEQMPTRLHEDHTNARWLAEQLAATDGCSIDIETVQTNIVVFRPLERSVTAIVEALKSKGVLCGTAGLGEIRLVTHRDVDQAACEQAVNVLKQVIRGV